MPPTAFLDKYRGGAARPVAAALLNPRLACVCNASERAAFLPQIERRLGALPIDALWLPQGVIWERWLRESRPDILLTGWSTPPLPAAWIESPDCTLRYVCHLAGSVKRLVPRSFIEAGGTVSNWGWLAAEGVAEHALLLALSALRNQGNWRKIISLKNRDSEPSLLGTKTLFDRGVGIHGFGAVARALVRLLRPFRTHVRSYSAGVPRDVFLQEGVTPCASLDELLGSSHIFFECESLTPATEGCIGRRELSLLPDEAVFVNVARGQLVDEAALVAEGRGGRVRVATDVVVAEPLTFDNPLCALEDAVLSPHIAGPTRDQYVKIGEFALSNIERYLRGAEVESRVTLDIYDRST